MDYSPPGSSVHEISQARILEQVAIFFSRGSSWCKDRTRVSCIAGGFFTAELPGKPYLTQNVVVRVDKTLHVKVLCKEPIDISDCVCEAKVLAGWRRRKKVALECIPAVCLKRDSPQILSGWKMARKGTTSRRPSLDRACLLPLWNHSQSFQVIFEYLPCAGHHVSY